EKTFAATLARHIGKTGSPGASRARRHKFLTGEADQSAFCPLGADEELEKLALTGAGKPGQPDDLASPQCEGDAGDARPSKLMRFEHYRVANWHRVRRTGPTDVAADHHADDVVGARLADRSRRHHGAVAENGDAVTKTHDLVEPMRDVEDGAAGAPE